MATRKGNSGRIPDLLKDGYTKSERFNITLPPDTSARMRRYCTDEERALSWVIQKALDEWLEKRGY